jgi:predicted peptidase
MHRGRHQPARCAILYKVKLAPFLLSLGVIASKLGTSLMGIETMRISRSPDVLIRRPEVDPQRVGMIGLSYGGFFTLYTMALDPRIQAGVASCSIRDREVTKADVPEGRPV